MEHDAETVVDLHQIRLPPEWRETPPFGANGPPGWRVPRPGPWRVRVLAVRGGGVSFDSNRNGIGAKVEWSGSAGEVERQRSVSVSRALGDSSGSFSPRASLCVPSLSPTSRVASGTLGHGSGSNPGIPDPVMSHAWADPVQGPAARTGRSACAIPEGSIPTVMVVAGFVEIGARLSRDKRLSAESPGQAVRWRRRRARFVDGRQADAQRRHATSARRQASSGRFVQRFGCRSRAEAHHATTPPLPLFHLPPLVKTLEKRSYATKTEAEEALCRAARTNLREREIPRRAAGVMIGGSNPCETLGLDSSALGGVGDLPGWRSHFSI